MSRQLQSISLKSSICRRWHNLFTANSRSAMSVQNRVDYPPPTDPPIPATADDTQSLTEKWSVHLPRRLLILPPTALLLGAFIGVSRGGTRARLRFLAENAHRQPTTIQGWVSFLGTDLGRYRWEMQMGDANCCWWHSTFIPRRAITGYFSAP